MNTLFIKVKKNLCSAFAENKTESKPLTLQRSDDDTDIFKEKNSKKNYNNSRRV
jgi:hypothetical protein